MDTIKSRNKASKQLICSCDKNIVKKDSQILWIYFMPMYGWLDKAIKLLMKNHEIRLICSIPRSECSNKYYEFISCLCMAEQSNELLIKNHETCPNWFCSILRSECNNILFIFSWSIMILILDMVIKKISKTHFVTRSDTIMWKKEKEKENVKILTKRWRYILSLRW